MSDLVERLREIGAHYSACDRQRTIYEAADALEAAQARIAPMEAEIASLQGYIAGGGDDDCSIAGFPDPDMPAQQLRLHMGEITAQEMRTARAAIRWANSAAQARIEAVRRETPTQHVMNARIAEHRKAVEWLHSRANAMNDPHAKQILNSAALAYGVSRALTEAKEDRT